MRRYAKGITWILNFVVNVVSRGDLDEHKVALPAGLADAVNRQKLRRIAAGRSAERSNAAVVFYR
jgi:hypothetical protein